MVDSVPCSFDAKFELIPELEDLLKQFYTRTNQYMQPAQKPPLLYHYTDIHGLYGIMENRCFWASNVNFINDAEEYNYGISQVKQSVESLDGHNKLKDEIKFFQFLSGKKQHIYCMSFCENKDLLSQWRGYGKGGVAFSIGIKNLSYSFAVGKMPGIHGDALFPAYPRKIIYDQSTISKVIFEWIELAQGKAFVDLLCHHKDRDRIQMSMWEALANTLPLFKHNSFQEEQEWRYIIFEPHIAEHTSGILVNHFPLLTKFRARGDFFLPYVELKSENIVQRNPYPRLPICEIVVGPAPKETQELIKANLEFYLQANSICDIIVSISEIPFRK